MKENSYKKYIVLFLTLCGTAFAGCILLTAVVDPFFHYHGPLESFRYTIDNQLSHNPGIAKNYEYDSVILGSSMTINFDTELFAETMGLNTVKLSYNGAFPKDIDNIMPLVKKSSNKVKNIFLGIDIFNYKVEPGKTACEIPQYLYDDLLWNDLPYLLNKEVVIEYILTTQENTPLNEIYSNWKYVECSRDKVLASYAAPQTFSEPLEADCYRSNIEENMNAYILPYIDSMPETQFTVFFPPYSILYWYSRFADGSLEAEIEGERQIVEMLLERSNVSVFYFQNRYDFITNLDNYSDYTHYSHEMNDEMTRCFADGTDRLTEENYAEMFDGMLEMLSQCDFESYLH